MFDFRYHALSLVAVFLALAVGLLLGVAIGDAGLVSSAGDKVRRGLRSDVRAEQAHSRGLRASAARARPLRQLRLSAARRGRLSGSRVGILALGGLPGGAIDNVRNALKDTGARLDTVAVLREPVSLGPLSDSAVIDAITPRPACAAQEGPTRRQAGRTPPVVQPNDLGTIGATAEPSASISRRAGRWSRSCAGPCSHRPSGSFSGVEAVVLLRPGADLPAADARATQAFEDGLVAGLTENNVPVVGVEKSDAEESQIPGSSTTTSRASTTSTSSPAARRWSTRSPARAAPSGSRTAPSRSFRTLVDTSGAPCKLHRSSSPS